MAIQDIKLTEYGAAINDRTDDTLAWEGALRALVEGGGRARILFDHLGVSRVKRSLRIQRTGKPLTLEGIVASQCVLVDSAPGNKPVIERASSRNSVEHFVRRNMTVRRTKPSNGPMIRFNRTVAGNVRGMIHSRLNSIVIDGGSQGGAVNKG